MTQDPIATIVSGIRCVRQDWQPSDIAAVFRQAGMPRETLLRGLAAGCLAVGTDGAYVLTRPEDVHRGSWLVAAQAEVDQLDALHRDRRGRRSEAT